MSNTYNTSFTDIDSAIADVQSQFDNKKITQEQYEDAMASLIGSKYEKGFDQEQFDTLLKKLTGSKIRQGRAAGIEQRKGAYAGGLAGMMSNF
jgi:hypothetical protein